MIKTKEQFIERLCSATMGVIGLQYLSVYDTWSVYCDCSFKGEVISEDLAKLLVCKATPRVDHYILPAANSSEVEVSECTPEEWLVRLACGSKRESYSFEILVKDAVDLLTEQLV